MAKFKKLDISEEDYKELLRDVVDTFYDESNTTYGEDIDVAIRKHVFNVQEPFNPDAWHSCTNPPPKEYRGKDMVIRAKSILRTDAAGHTGDRALYTIGYHDGENYIMNDDILTVNEDTEKYEYKLIK